MLFLKLFALIPFYLIGAFPTGRMIAKKYGVNLEEHGSGNVGATNVARTIGKKAGIFTLLVDIFKGALVVLLASLVNDSPWFIALCGIAAVAGHCFSIPSKLKGGKGVATALGVYLFLSPQSAAFGLLVFALLILAFQIVSLASVSAALAIPVFAMFIDLPEETLYGLIVISLIVVFRHKDNLIRLSEGREKKIHLK